MLHAGVQDDILIAGWTDYDINSAGLTYDQKLAALEATIAEWGGADLYATRLTKLASYLNSSTMHDNYVNGVAAADQLRGNIKVDDWFFAGVKDQVSGKSKNAVKTLIN
jgi:hypothetical protein